MNEEDIRMFPGFPNSCYECSHSSDKIPDTCPIWQLESEEMIRAFNNKSGVHEGCTRLVSFMKFTRDMISNSLLSTPDYIPSMYPDYITNIDNLF